MGATDPDNVTLTVLRAIESIPVDGLEVRVTVGPGNPHRESLVRVAGVSRASIDLRFDPPDIGELMAWADVAVAAAGSTSWERAMFGLPSVVLVLADNQQRIASALVEAGCASLADFPREVDSLAREISCILANPARRQAMSERGQRIVDGAGARRVVNVLLSGETPVHAHPISRQ